jgi:hypothetical protein
MSGPSDLPSLAHQAALTRIIPIRIEGSTAASIWLQTRCASARSSSPRSALIAARRAQKAARACAQIPIQRTNPPDVPDIAGWMVLGENMVIFLLQCFRAAKRGRSRETLVAAAARVS